MRVIVTGASGGIGRGIATVLARHGCAVGGFARSAESLEALASHIRESGGVCHTVTGDLRDMESTSHAIRELMERLGGVDALVNNGGIVLRKDIFTISPDEWHAMVETNVNGLYYATRAVIGAMREQGHEDGALPRAGLARSEDGRRGVGQIGGSFQADARQHAWLRLHQPETPPLCRLFCGAVLHRYSQGP